MDAKHLDHLAHVAGDLVEHCKANGLSPGDASASLLLAAGVASYQSEPSSFATSDLARARALEKWQLLLPYFFLCFRVGFDEANRMRKEGSN